MMKALRSSVSGLAAKILFGVIVVAFVVTGFSSFFSSASPTTVVQVGDTPVSILDYRFVYQSAEQQLSNRARRRVTREEAEAAGIDQYVLQTLINNALLDEQGRRIGLGMSEDKLLGFIQANPEFHDATGNYSRNRLRDVLAGAGLTEAQFIHNEQRGAVRSQLVDAVSEGVAVPAVVESALALYNGERRTVDTVTLPVSVVGTIADPAPDVLSNYFDGKKSAYRAPEYRSIAYAALTPEVISNAEAITDQQVADDYQRGIARYTVAEKRRVQQIVYPSPDAAKAAKSAIDAGKTFEQSITDSGRSLADAELGLRAKSEIPDAAIADAVFALGANEVSAVVDGAFGPVLLRVTAIEPEQRQPLEAVAAEIRKELALNAATTAVQEAEATFEDTRASGATIEEAAKRSGIEVKTIPAIDRRGRGPDGVKIENIPAEGDLLQGAFEAEVGTETQPLNIDSNGYLFYDVRSIDVARDRTLDEVKDKVVADWKAGETQRLLTEKVEAFRKRVEAGETLDTIAAEAGVTKGVANAITRESGIGEIGDAATSAAFSGPVGTIASALAQDGTSQLLLKVTDVSAPAAAAIPPQQKQQLAGMMREDILRTYYAALAAQTHVSQVNVRAIEQAQVRR